MNFYDFHDKPETLHGHAPNLRKHVKKFDAMLLKLDKGNKDVNTLRNTVTKFTDRLLATSEPVQRLVIKNLDRCMYIRQIAVVMPPSVYNRWHIEKMVRREIKDSIEYDLQPVDDLETELQHEVQQRMDSFNRMRATYTK